MFIVGILAITKIFENYLARSEHNRSQNFIGIHDERVDN